ncbi:MAG: porin [Thiobacillus sp.]
MNRKLIALAIAGIFAAPVALAATANVEIYGTMALSVDSVDGGSGAADDTITSKDSERRMRVSSHTSAIGFKGSEDLGGGLSAVWQVESLIGMNDKGTEPGGLFGGRNTFAGLSSKTLGTLTFGVMDTALKLSTAKLDVFTTTQLADYRSVFTAVSNASIRAKDSVSYVSPTFSGLTFRGTTAALQEEGSTSNPHLYSLSGTYENGPLFVTLAHEDMKFAKASGTMFGAAGASTGSNAIFAAGVSEAEQKNTRLGVGYSFGDLKLGAAWERTKVDVTGTLAANANFGTTTAQSTDRDGWYLSAAYKLGAHTFKAAYSRAGDLEGTSDTGAQQISAGVDHALSKRTTVYALVTQVSNDANASYSLGGGPASTGTFQSSGGSGLAVVNAAAPGQDPRAISVGMIHKF